MESFLFSVNIVQRTVLVFRFLPCACLPTLTVNTAKGHRVFICRGYRKVTI